MDTGYPPAPPRPPAATPYDVYRGLAPTATSASGNVVSRDQFGNTSVTNKYGVTTIQTPQGQAFGSLGNPLGSSLIEGPLSNAGGVGKAFEPKAALGGRSPFGNFARGAAGTVGGAALGSLLAGPLGAMLGGALGREIAKPGGGAVGGLLGRNSNNLSPYQSGMLSNGGSYVSGIRLADGSTFSRSYPGPSAQQRAAFERAGGTNYGAASPQARDALASGSVGLY